MSYDVAARPCSSAICKEDISSNDKSTRVDGGGGGGGGGVDWIE